MKLSYFELLSNGPVVLPGAGGILSPKLREIAALGDQGGGQILLVPEHASHAAEVDLCRDCGPAASRHAEVLSFRRLCDRVLSITGGAAQVTLDAGGKLLTLEKALLEVLPELTVYRRPSRKSAFLRQLLDLFDELRCYEVTPEALFQQSQDIAGATRDKLRDLSLIYAAYESRLLRPGLPVRLRLEDRRTQLLHCPVPHTLRALQLYLVPDRVLPPGSFQRCNPCVLGSIHYHRQHQQTYSAFLPCRCLTSEGTLLLSYRYICHL